MNTTTFTSPSVREQLVKSPRSQAMASRYASDKGLGWLIILSLLTALTYAFNAQASSSPVKTTVDPSEQYELGRRYEHGIGVNVDPGKAVVFYRKAAMQNLAKAQYSLGRLYAAGEGVSQNYAEAHKWFEKAAAQNYVLAQNRLGRLYELGLGTSKDFVAAYNWYSRAAKNSVAARANLNGLIPHMTAEQLAEAQLFSTTWSVSR